MRLGTNTLGPDYGNQLVDDFGAIPTPTDAEVRAARLYVAGQALDVEDARELLGMLGLAAS